MQRQRGRMGTRPQFGIAIDIRSGLPYKSERRLMPNKVSYDAVVVGSGPNGLAAAIRLAQEKLSVLVLEANDTIGGGTRSAELTNPGFIHDVCSAVHPLGIGSP